MKILYFVTRFVFLPCKKQKKNIFWSKDLMDKHFTQSQLVHSAICEVWNWNWQIICPQGYCSQLTPPRKLMTSYTWEFTKELYWQVKTNVFIFCLLQAVFIYIWKIERSEGSLRTVLISYIFVSFHRTVQHYFIYCCFNIYMYL